MACPDHDVLFRFVERKLPPAQAYELEKHLDGCEDCHGVLVALARSTSFVALVDAKLVATGVQKSIVFDDTVASPTVFETDEEPSLSEGTLVDHFEILGPLGRGGMGEVYLAADTKLDRHVALKLVQPKLLGSDDALRRFQAEAKTTAKFSHPNIVTIHAVGEHEGKPYVALEYLEGETLRDRIWRAPLPLEETLTICLAIGKALQEAHSHSVLHRDLKPANVLLGNDGRTRVLDFGLAKTVASSQPTSDESPEGSAEDRTGQAGSPRYMAPEQWRGGPMGHATDVWALGVILFEMLARRPPFSAETLEELIPLVCSDTPAPELDCPDVPPEIQELVRKCLQKSSSRRASVDEFVAVLREALSTAERSPEERGAGSVRRMVAVASLFVAASVIAVVSLSAKSTDQHSSPPPNGSAAASSVAASSSKPNLKTTAGAGATTTGLSTGTELPTVAATRAAVPPKHRVSPSRASSNTAGPSASPAPSTGSPAATATPATNSDPWMRVGKQTGSAGAQSGK